LLLVVFSQNIILAIVAEAYEEAKALLGSANTSFVVLIFLRLLFLFVLFASKVRKVLRGLWRAGYAACCGVPPDGPDGVSGPSITHKRGGSFHSSYSSAGAPVDLASDDYKGVNSNPSLGASPEDVEAPAGGTRGLDGRAAGGRSLQRAMTHLQAIKMDAHDERMYREMQVMAQRTLRGSWGSWARRYFAPWAVVRTPGVRSLTALYQDYAGFKIKTQPPWIGVSVDEGRGGRILRGHSCHCSPQVAVTRAQAKNPAQLNPPAPHALKPQTMKHRPTKPHSASASPPNPPP